LLRKREIIVSDNSYKIGEKSLHYKINPELEITPGFVELLPDSNIYKKLKRNAHNKRAHVCDLKPYLYAMYLKFNSLVFDYDNAIKWVAQNKTLGLKNTISYSYSIEMFRNKDMRYFKRNKTNNRLDTNITNLPKVLRRFILTPNLVSIDLKNSQPFILSLTLIHILQHHKQPTNPLCYHIKKSNMLKPFGAWVIKDILKTHEIESNHFYQELSKFNDWTLSGKFYDNFIANYNSVISRDKVKKAMIHALYSANIEYKNNCPYIPYEKDKKIFAQVFPNIYNISNKCN
jgi:hypothetical protein